MLGPSKGISTEKFRVICPAGLGSPFGSTSPLSINPATGKAYNATFPQITPRDMARAHMALLESLSVHKAHALVGASLGGCVALSFASEYPDFVDNLCVISCTGKSTPGSVALRHIQRQAVLRDPNYCNGNYREKGVNPSNGMAVARQLGMVTYRTREEFNQRFSWDAAGPYHLGDAINFEVESYLQNKAGSFVDNYDPNSYLLLSKCTDLMDLGRGHKNFSEGLLRINSKVMIMGVDSDFLIPPSEQQYMHHLLQAHGKDVRLRTCGSIYGHDAFLLDMGWFLPHIRDFLEHDHHRHPHGHPACVHPY
jgi:homoserine O-acetyltransferase